MGGQPARPTPSPVNSGERHGGAARGPSSDFGGPSGRPSPAMPPLQQPGAVARATLADRRRMKSLDRSLKTFLRLSNLPGLEYRLRLAGYYTVVDLLGTTEETLVARGFTPLMARRLMTALDDYVRRHVEVGPHIQFKMVRRGQKMRTEASEKVKSMPTYGRMNVKRQGSLPDGLSNTKGSRPSLFLAPKTPARVRLMSDEVLSLQHLIQLPNMMEGDQTQPLIQPGSAMEGDQTQHLMRSFSAIEGNQTMEGDQTQHVFRPLSAIESDQTQQLFRPLSMTEGDQTQYQGFAGDVDAAQERVIPLEQAGGGEDLLNAGFRESISPTSADDADRLLMTPSPLSILSPSSSSTMIRSTSIPADFRWTGLDAYNTEWFLHHHVRHYSCPPRLRSLGSQPLSDIKAAIDNLKGAGDADSVFLALQQLVQGFRRSSVGGGVRTGGREAVEAVLGVMEQFCYSPKIVKCSLRVLKCITRGAPPERGSLSHHTMAVVMEAMCCDPVSEQLQLQGLLAMGNIGRADPDQCTPILFSGGVLTVAAAMVAFDACYSIQVAALSVLAVALAHAPAGRLKLLDEDGHVLDLALSAMEGFPREPRVQQYGCAFLALLICEVSEQIESGVMQLLVERAMVAMATHSHVHQIALWGSKVFAHAASSAALDDWKLVGRCCELLTEALEDHPQSSDVQKWAAYALHRMATSQRFDVCGMLVRSSVLGHCCKPPRGLESEARTYLEHLANLLDKAGCDGDQTQPLPWQLPT